MAILDPRFRLHKGRYVMQCALVVVALTAVLALLNAIANAAVIAALGASCFIAFTMPHRDVSKPRYLIGSYVIGTLLGSACFWISKQVALPEHLGAMQNLPYMVFGGLAVGASVFLMVITNTEHPPAASIALGFVLLSEWHVLTVVVVLVGIVAICVVHRLLKRVLIDLL